MLTFVFLFHLLYVCIVQTSPTSFNLLKPLRCSKLTMTKQTYNIGKTRLSIFLSTWIKGPQRNVCQKSCQKPKMCVKELSLIVCHWLCVKELSKTKNVCQRVVIDCVSLIVCQSVVKNQKMCVKVLSLIVCHRLCVKELSKSKNVCQRVVIDCVSLIVCQRVVKNHKYVSKCCHWLCVIDCMSKSCQKPKMCVKVLSKTKNVCQRVDKQI